METKVTIQGIDIDSYRQSEPGKPEVFSGKVRVRIEGAPWGANDIALPFSGEKELSDGIKSALESLRDFGGDLSAAASGALSRYKFQ